MAFPESFLEELISRNEISDVVSGYVQLTQKGSNMFGLCPFHSEKTPSFSVSQDKQIYHCFGCGKGGGVINFIMEIENLTFPEAVEFLARRVGMTVPEEGHDENRRRRERMLSLNRDAARFFHDTLYSPQGLKSLEYARSRGITKQMITRFGLGAAPDGWSSLTDAMLKKGYTKEELLDAGLAGRSQKTGNIYDNFRARFMFPIIDVRGNVIGFSGRVLEGSDRKYINTKDTLVFNKKRNLFALNLAKKSKSGYIILTEGNIDVVSLHQAGFDCAVATLGTALTEEQGRLLSRYTDKIILSYDSDSAGMSATKRAIDILGRVGLDVKVLQMQGAKDPDEYIRKYGRDAFSQLIDRSENHIEYRLLAVKNKYNLEQDEDRVKFLGEAAELLAALQSPAERAVYGMRVAEAAGVSRETVEAETKRAFKRKVNQEKKKQERMEMRPELSVQPKPKSIKYENPASAVAEEGIIRLMILDPALFDGVNVDSRIFSSEYLAKVFETIRTRQLSGRSTAVASLAGELSPDEISHLTEILAKPENLANGEQALADYIETIKTENLKRTSQDDLRAVSEKYREKKGYGG